MRRAWNRYPVIVAALILIAIAFLWERTKKPAPPRILWSECRDVGGAWLCELKPGQEAELWRK